MTEIETLQECDNEHINRFVDVFIEQNRIKLVTEFAKGKLLSNCLF